MSWEQWIAVTALVVAVVALLAAGIGWRALRGRSHERLPAPPRAAASSHAPAAVVFNPTASVDRERLVELVAAASAECGLGEATWFETTIADPGTGQAARALAGGASVVIAAGGDGTVRAVAQAMAGSNVPMAILPLGTGNLFARNLDLPLLSQREMITTALTGRDRRIDLGWLRIIEPAEDPTEADAESEVWATGTAVAEGVAAASAVEPTTRAGDGAVDVGREHPFLVIGGMGFDAAMVGGAGTELKARIGWIAYFVAGARHLRGRKVRARVALSDGEPSDEFTARTVLVANCGRLPGGVVLLPDAEPDDGWLDIAAIDTRSGLIGWIDLLRRVILQGFGIRRGLLPYSTSTLSFHRSRHVVIRTFEAEQVQVDGDLLGAASAISARVAPGALLVRTR